VSGKHCDGKMMPSKHLFPCTIVLELNRGAYVVCWWGNGTLVTKPDICCYIIANLIFKKSFWSLKVSFQLVYLDDNLHNSKLIWSL
jgi:hypothetical protein